MPQVHSAICSEWGISPSLLEAVSGWSDVQSLLQRTTDGDIVMKPLFVKKMHATAVALLKWSRYCSSSQKVLKLALSSGGGATSLTGDVSLLSARNMGLTASFVDGGDGEDNMDATDAGGEDGSDGEGDGDGDVDGDVEGEGEGEGMPGAADAALDHDTETEMPVEAEMDENEEVQVSQ